MKKKLNIKGHSGCMLDVVETDYGRLMVKKGCKESYTLRLKCQQAKQQAAYIRNDIINVPYSYWDPYEQCIMMDYIYSDSFIDYFERASTNDIRTITDTLIKYIDDEIEHSAMTDVNVSILIDKVKSVKESCKNNDILYIKKTDEYCDHCIEMLKQLGDTINIPVGCCHGDLTFSNILFTDADMWVIDFLDSFIETPLQDIVKLRQDTVYKWSTMMTDQKYNAAHIYTVLDYIDRCIVEHFKKYDFYIYYDILQYINILRIFPYVKEKKVYVRLCDIVDKMIERTTL